MINQFLYIHFANSLFIVKHCSIQICGQMDVQFTPV